MYLKIFSNNRLSKHISASALVLLVVLLGACQTASNVNYSSLPAKDMFVASRAMNKSVLRFTGGEEWVINFERFNKNGEFGFCVYGVSDESGVGIISLWFEESFIFLGDKKVVSGRIIPLHTTDSDGRYLSRCVLTELSYEKYQYKSFNVKGSAVRIVG